MEFWSFGNILKGISFKFTEGFLENPDIFQRVEFSPDIDGIISGNIILKGAKYLQFLNFYKNKLINGTLPFIYYDCLDAEDKRMCFVDKPKIKEQNSFYIVNLSLREC